MPYEGDFTAGGRGTAFGFNLSAYTHIISSPSAYTNPSAITRVLRLPPPFYQGGDFCTWKWGLKLIRELRLHIPVPDGFGCTFSGHDIRCQMCIGSKDDEFICCAFKTKLIWANGDPLKCDKCLQRARPI